MHGKQIARLILQGFHAHYRGFQGITEEARDRFVERDWVAIQYAARARISFYDARVNECVETLREQLQTDIPDSALWQHVRTFYEALLQFHPQAELAETFFNSVFCKLFHRRYFHNRFIFVESTLARRIPLSVETEYQSYFPVADGVKATLRNILEDMNLGAPFADLERDVHALMRAFAKQAQVRALSAHQMRVDVLRSPFYRNKAAYIVGRIVTEQHQYPFIVPVLINRQGQLYLDALITDVDQMVIIFSFARAYFMVKTRAPSALVRFLKGLMPRKTLAELYSAIGFHKQGKTEFYRELLGHLASSDDKLVAAPGIRGLVMMVFTLPSFPYVFKIIRDQFPESKPFGRDTVLARYQLVKRHDRVGRMADTIEYSDVALPRERFSEELLEELQSTASLSIKVEDDLVILRHCYIEKRMIPLNLYMEYASADETREIIADYGLALKEMIAANIFPGDMLLKNFGVTRGKRVVFYDYDEVQYLHEVNFRELPKPETYEDSLAADTSHSVAPNDVFPEQVATFVFPNKALRELFIELHPELIEASYWSQQQQAVAEGVIADVFPYPQHIRFHYEKKPDTK
ncbi:bifunctional isocitrate dehydrogenase kinase/phosphatase [Aliidiomarina halalkaliphila]|uniref:Isocitrate dehydrogenase kinase/phosphatase n=1 Tax=Aliidiomarina halalkaliphila TaxID=2593535 RepID=A0A552WZE6_9GAMM|nr:bifunctional isocitrate dehydrogenase kinase/phosphatase [Aliidiomarina halalkaliphila]TRW48191.1 bifunctional isocitrate dehydrogenase kinase/phosphatase [Aliidiomarina halalkaliphila]